MYKNKKLILKRAILFFVLLISPLLFCQDLDTSHQLDSLYFAENRIELIPGSISVKNAPKNFELPFLVALSYFPDLIGKNIIFKSRNINTTLNARPNFSSLLFSKKQNRTYVIRINNSFKDSIISLNNVPFNAQVGVFAHELSHFTDYNSRSFFGIIGRGFAYFSKKSKAKFEKEIDAKTIERGLGWQLYAWSEYIQNQSNATVNYKEFKRNIYLTPVEILEAIEKITS